jgi:hypothetical protein
MNKIIHRVINKVMAAFVGSGISISEQGELCLPDGLCPNRVHRFIELCTNERFASPREAMHALFTRLRVSPRAVGLLDEIIDSKGDLEFGAIARHTGGLMRALPEFKQIPLRFRDFLVDDLGLASNTCEHLDEAVASAREAAAARVGCEATWDAILENSAAISALAHPWRERVAAA